MRTMIGGGPGAGARALVAWLICTTLGVGHAGAATIYDLTTDWSDSANPNGPWAYREGANLLPHVPAWQGLSGDFTSAQPAWARFETGTSNLPCVFRSSANVGITHDWEMGDVICHSTDGFNGLGSGDANITWTSPVTGTVSVSGAIWMGRDIGRGNHWSLAVNGSERTAGNVFSGDAYSRATPMEFSAGTGGAAALSAIPVAIGDVIRLTLTRTAAPGDYSGLRMQVALVAPSAVADGGADDRPRLDPPGPNPVTSATHIRFALPREAAVDLAVFDVSGHRVTTLARGSQRAGERSLVWDAHVPSGVYLVRLEVGGVILTRRVAVLR
jgi:hypothetical protein